MSRPRRASRRRSRQAALQVLYALDVSAHRSPGPEAEVCFEDSAASFELPEGARAFAKDLVTGVIAQLPELDRILAAHATNWRVERMAAVDRNVLRMAVYELRSSDTPAAVVIDEAVDLARRFGGEASPAFVNGILDAVSRGLDRRASTAAV